MNQKQEKIKELNIKIPDVVNSYTQEKQTEIYNYLHTMNEQDKKAYHIALEHLGSSFDICRSVGFVKWEKTKN